MNLTYDEKIAILWTIGAVGGADGTFQHEEETFRGKVAIFLDLYHSEDDNTRIYNALKKMDARTAISLLTPLDMITKKFVVAVMMGTMNADNIQTEKEKHTIEVLSRYANLPMITDKEAHDILNKYGLIGSTWNLVWRQFL